MSLLPSKRYELWTFRQRKTLLAGCSIVLIFLCIENRRKPIELADPPGSTPSRANEIQDRLNPNTANAAALSAIPNLGESRARLIVEYRENFARQHRGMPPFNSSRDLMQVKGIGPGIANDVEPFLTFSADAASH